MAILVIAEHDNESLKPASFNTVTAAKEIEGEGEIEVLVAGKDCQNVADKAARIAGITKVIVADDVCYEYQLAESVAPLVADIGKNYSHIFAAATTTEKIYCLGSQRC